jgi:hypothetical protein
VTASGLGHPRLSQHGRSDEAARRATVAISGGTPLPDGRGSVRDRHGAGSQFTKHSAGVSLSNIRGLAFILVEAGERDAVVLDHLTVSPTLLVSSSSARWRESRSLDERGEDLRRLAQRRIPALSLVARVPFIIRTLWNPNDR